MLAALVLGLLSAGVARADTVYLKSGRSIHAESVEIVGDRVVMIQGGNRIELPMAVVERIVPDEEAGGTAIPTPGEPRPATQTPAPTGDAEAGEVPEGGGEEGGAPEAETSGGAETREVWQERVAAIHDEQEQKKQEIEVLRREERAFLFSRRSTAETRQKIAAAEARITALDQALVDLRRDARKKGVPPGWLR